MDFEKSSKSDILASIIDSELEPGLRQYLKSYTQIPNNLKDPSKFSKPVGSRPKTWSIYYNPREIPRFQYSGAKLKNNL